MEGTLNKWTNVMKGWQLRWFVMDEHAGLLSYYTSKEKMMRGSRRGCVRLKGAVVGIEDEDDALFTITVDGKAFHLQARDGDERDQWVSALENTVAVMNQHAGAHRFRYRETVGGQSRLTMADFDRQLVESDAYLQLLIQQAQQLRQRQQLTGCSTERDRLSALCQHVNAMLDSIKHTIVRLQIAKNEVQPVIGSYAPVSSADIKNRPGPPTSQRTAGAAAVGDGVLESSGASSASAASGVMSAAGAADVQGGSAAGFLAGDVAAHDRAVDAALESTHSSLEGLDDMVLRGIGPLNRYVLDFPETSYSSSEDEDWFDTEDPETGVARAGSSSGPRPPSSTAVLLSSAPSTSTAAPPVDPAAVGQTGISYADYDAAYEEQEGDLGSMENCRSVISHLLSQMRIGMDLTRVVLPTFILERRSLLEMYADFFAHPDLFTSIPKCTTARDRLVQVLKWYLSAFHAGRKSEVAKKPYNPIIGETFRCVFDLPTEGVEVAADVIGEVPASSAAAVDDPVTDGPVSWGRRDQVCFVAEQVSHHPPVSAFYAEHYAGRLSFCGHIWTKSKFLGLSIGVHNIGQGCVSVLDHDEEYMLTFPSGYGRSILSVPWIELGGVVTISCSRTGYSANVEFQTKPFYGGRKHRIVAEAFEPGAKKSFLQVEGEWNGLMTAKWDSGETEVFVDTHTAPLVNKQVKSISEQDEYESRRLWKDVTYNLKYDYIEAATEAKCFLEQRQRDEAKSRLLAEQQWKTKLFHKFDENWVYDTPLQRRLATTSPS